MEEEVNLVDFLLIKSDEIIAGVIFDSYTGVVAQFFPILVSLLALALLITAMKIGISTPSVDSLKQIAMRWITIIFAWVMLTEWAVFSSIIYDAIVIIPNAMSESLVEALTGEKETTYAGVHTAWESVQKVSLIIFSSVGMSPSTWQWIFWGILYSLCGFWMVLYLGLILFIAKVGVGMMLIFAPFALMCLMFAWTSQVFVKWLQVTVGVALIPVFLTIALVFSLALMGTQITDLADSGKPLRLTDVLLHIALFIVSTALFHRAVGIASTVATGVRIDGPKLSGTIKKIALGIAIGKLFTTWASDRKQIASN